MDLSLASLPPPVFSAVSDVVLLSALFTGNDKVLNESVIKTT